MGSWKLETDVSAAELPQVLRQLAQALESARAEASGPLAGLPADFRKLVLVAEVRKTGYALKLKAKRAGEVLVPTKKNQARHGQASLAKDQARDKYRQLKKALQADYKALQKAAEAGAMPAQDVLESFLALCEAMAEAPQPLNKAEGRSNGPEAAELAKANRTFLDDARALRRAVSGRDAAALAEVLSRLERRKSACHVQFR